MGSLLIGQEEVFPAGQPVPCYDRRKNGQLLQLSPKWCLVELPNGERSQCDGYSCLSHTSLPLMWPQRAMNDTPHLSRFVNWEPKIITSLTIYVVLAPILSKKTGTHTPFQEYVCLQKKPHGPINILFSFHTQHIS